MRHRLLPLLLLFSGPAWASLTDAPTADAAGGSERSSGRSVATRPDGWRRTASGWEWAGAWDLEQPSPRTRDVATDALRWHERIAATAGEIHPVAVAAGLLGTALMIAASERSGGRREAGA